MKALVTGATGFLGKKVAIRLKQLGFETTGIGRNEKVGKELKNEGIHFIKMDLAEQKKLINVCKEQDYIVHCAALSSPWGKFEDFFEANVVGTKNIIQAAKHDKLKRLVHISTPSIYFKYNERLNVKEEDELPKNFVNFYAETKYMAEKEMDKAFQEGLPVITLRPRALFGPNDNSIIPRLIKTNQEKFVPIIHQGKVLMDLTYVENVVDAILLCFDSPIQTIGQKYNITNGEQVYLIDILENLFTQLDIPLHKKKLSFLIIFQVAKCLEWIANRFQNGKEPILTKYTVSVLSKSQTLSIQKAKEELGYSPRISIDEGIKEFAKWWKGEYHGH